MSPLQGRAVVVLLALVDVYQENGRATVRDVSHRADVPLAMTHFYLTRLRRRGFCTWDDGRDGTLRPLVAEVAA